MQDKVLWFKCMGSKTLFEVKGFGPIIVPSYERAVNLCLSLHKTLPYFDLIGWDIAIGEDGTPVFIEYNLEPSIEGPQLSGGPLFGGYLDEVLSRASLIKKERGSYHKYTFEEGSQFFFHIKKV